MLREAIRRRMGLHSQWVRMMLWGFCDDLGRNLPVRSAEQLLEWSNGKLPMYPFKSDEQVKKEAEVAKEKQEMVAKEKEKNVTPAVHAGGEKL